MAENNVAVTSDANIRYLANVLVIEDNRIDSTFLAEMLESFGCRVDVSNNGYEAVEKLDKHFDLVFIDINMPEINGLEIANGVKNFGKTNRAFPIILVSGEEFTRSMEEKCISLNVDGYIQKPIKKDELREILGTLIPNREIKIFAGQESQDIVRGFVRLHRNVA